MNVFFFLLQKIRGFCWEKGRDHHIYVQLNKEKTECRAIRVFFNPVLFLRGAWRMGAISKQAG